MEKPADTNQPLHDLIRRRWSPRAFADRHVNGETLKTLLEAARWAPSSFNDQPWFYIVARREYKDEFERMLACLVEQNATWAARAPVLLISVARMTFDHNKKPNRHAMHDVGLATENLVLQATSMGLAVHQMAGFMPEEARKAYKIPKEYEPVAAMALGYPGSPEILPDGLQEREKAPRTRKPLDEFVFTRTWGAPAPWTQNS